MSYDNEGFVAGLPRRALRWENASHKSVTADVTLTTADPQKIHLDATLGIMTVTLPAPYEGLVFDFSEVAGLATAVTITASAGTTINGVASLTMNAAYRQRKLRGIGTTAWIVDGGIG